LQLSSPGYTAKVGSNLGFILEHSTRFKPRNSEIELPLNYSDYYYPEALKQLKEYEK